MGYFAGLDVSLEETAVCVVGMTMERIGLEACSLTAWLHGGLTEAGLPATCIEARQAKAAMGNLPPMPPTSTSVPRIIWLRTR